MDLGKVMRLLEVATMKAMLPKVRAIIMAVIMTTITIKMEMVKGDSKEDHLSNSSSLTEEAVAAISEVTKTSEEVIAEVSTKGLAHLAEVVTKVVASNRTTLLEEVVEVSKSSQTSSVRIKVALKTGLETMDNKISSTQ